MTAKFLYRLLITVTMVTLVLTTGCERDVDTLSPAPLPTSPEVFLDVFGPDVDYQAFSNSKLDALTIDGVVKHEGSKSMRITVPSVGDPSGWFAGGAFVTGSPRNLSGYNALTFYAKASMVAPLGLAGFGNDNTGTSKFTAWQTDLSLTTVWQKYIIPIPLGQRLQAEQGVFQYSAGADGNGDGYYIWFDEVQFENLGTIAHPRPAISSQTVSAQIGDSVIVDGTIVTFDIAGSEVVVNAAPGYFSFESSDESVATVDADGVIEAVGVGSATITAQLGTVDAAGSVVVTVQGASPGPTAAAPTPTLPAGDVISLFSNAYTDVSVDTWSAAWDVADLADIQIAGDDTKLYTNLSFAGIEFTSSPIDASAMTHFHMDVWTPDPTAAPAAFKIKLVDFGADGAFGGGDDVEHELLLNGSTTPAMATGTWVGLDIPLSDFAGLTTQGHLAQLIISGDPNTVYLDNVYFFTASASTEPSVAAPTPTQSAGEVISLFSNAYTNVTVDTWSAAWDNADVADVQVVGNDTKLYTNLIFAGIEFTSAPIDATSMTHFHMDVWTPDPTASPAVFRMKLVDFGADGGFGGGDDVEHELTFDATTTPALTTGNWIGFDLPLADFTNLTTTGHLAQLIIVADPGPNTVYIDNVYFYGAGGTPTEPSTAAPTPTYPPGDVIALFSDPYTDVTVDTWSATWDNADLVDTVVAGDATKLYTNLVFAGIEFTSQTIDATTMTHFRIDIWTPDSTAAPAAFRVKLVDFGADGGFGGGDDVEHELTFDATTTPALITGNWISFDLPLTDFTNLTTTGHLAQLIIVADPGPNTVYMDNVLFHR
ncbi:Ig-like domain-containing protein [bacterium]|nr:Ig-like domain-containing protein [bacterium]